MNNAESPFKGKTGLQRLINATGYSIDGFKAAWLHESAFRQICLLAIAGIGLALWLPLPPWGRALIVFAHFLSIVVELINSAIEAAVDHTSLDHHLLAKRAKDLGSAAQLASLVNMAIIWGIVLNHF
ncbi:diacylglycerol kinase [Chitinimonas arctica]|uniref:Diacylglycerol kinase n=1 Tax=Chitinimonas arctica TaxID=2594795 RepID=A0A516SFJ6_9NEIS|nr:diacylglycerol kinase [Chitinimonas arctica]QDQ26929.1 diacylglycerol kinase [Chitinimonas arctica]